MTRTEAIEWLKSIKSRVSGGDEDFDKKRIEALDMAINSLKAEDADEFIPKRAGHWIKMFLTDTSDIDGQCSECGFIHKFTDGHTAQYNFCPTCGADMRGDTE